MSWKLIKDYVIVFRYQFEWKITNDMGPLPDISHCVRGDHDYCWEKVWVRAVCFNPNILRPEQRWLLVCWFQFKLLIQEWKWMYFVKVYLFFRIQFKRKSLLVMVMAWVHTGIMSLTKSLMCWCMCEFDHQSCNIIHLSYPFLGLGCCSCPNWWGWQ